MRRFGLVASAAGKPFRSRRGKDLRDTFLYAFAQKRVLQKPFGINHFVLFWSFMILLLANAEFLLHGVPPAISFDDPAGRDLHAPGIFSSTSYRSSPWLA